jgi:diguanylate cyclase (GGDEF)-like protein/PAS domain S-box-containing protein
MTAVETVLHDARSRVSTHPRLIELVRIAATLAQAPAEIVLLHDQRALVVATLGRTILQPRPLSASEREVFTTSASHAVTAEGVSFAVRERAGTMVGALSVHGQPEPRTVDALHGVARLIAELFQQDVVTSSGMWEALIEGQRDAIVVVDSDFRILFANRAVGNQFGRTPMELVGTNAIDLLHPDDLEAAFEAMVRLAGGREVYRLFVRVLHAEGEYHRFEITGNDLSDDPRVGGIVMSLRGDERDLELEAELEGERSMLRAVLDQLHDGIVTTDRFGAPTLVNQAARRMHGLTSDRPARLLSLDDLFVLSASGSPVDHQNHPVARVCRGETLMSESMSLLSEGQIRHVQVSGQPVVGAGGVQLGSVVGYHDVTNALQAQRELIERALHDQLTGLPNRRHLHEYFTSLRDKQTEGLLGVCFIDLDGFKLVNDTHGHRVGDMVVRDAAARLSGVLQNDCFLARVGGDEFVAVLSNVTKTEDAMAAAETIRSALRLPFLVAESELLLSASVGLALHDIVTFDEDVLLRQADIALYAAKACGRNRVELFTEALAVAAEHEQRQHEMLRNTLDRDGLVMYFQPLIDCHTEEVVGFEALARCRLSDGTLVGPSTFLDAAISSGLICELDRKAFDLSCQAVAALRQVRPDRHILMSCNFAALTIVQSNFVRDVLETVARHGIEPTDICVEITESTAFEAGDAAINALRELHELGFQLALDDFGTGYSSLAHLRDLPLASVKVDRSFTTHLGHGTSERAITQAVVHLASSLDLSLVAEGVETSEQLRQAREMGFRIIQGYYYSPARPLFEAMELL